MELTAFSQGNPICPLNHGKYTIRFTVHIEQFEIKGEIFFAINRLCNEKGIPYSIGSICQPLEYELTADEIKEYFGKDREWIKQQLSKSPMLTDDLINKLTA